MLGVAVSVLIRLKNVSEGPIERLPRESRSGIIGVYMSVILMSKVPLQGHTLVCHFLVLYSVFLILFWKTALDDFVSTFVTIDDFENDILPTIEKALLRSPEISLPGKFSLN